MLRVEKRILDLQTARPAAVDVARYLCQRACAEVRKCARNTQNRIAREIVSAQKWGTLNI